MLNDYTRVTNAAMAEAAAIPFDLEDIFDEDGNLIGETLYTQAGEDLATRMEEIASEEPDPVEAASSSR